MTEYDYTKSMIDFDVLTGQINQDANIGVLVDHIVFSPYGGSDNLQIFMGSALNTSQQSELNTVVTNHSCMPNYRFSVNNVYLSTLEDQIRADSSIITPLLYSAFNNSGILTTYFSNLLSAAEYSSLNTLVNNYVYPVTVTEIQTLGISPSSNDIRVQKEISPTNQNYRVTGLRFVTDGTTNPNLYNYSFPYGINILSVVYDPNSTIVDGDLLEITVTITVGNITANVSQGDTTIHVSGTALENFQVGRYLILCDGANKADLGQVTNVNSMAGTITTMVGSSFAFSATSPTYILLDTVFSDTFNSDGTFTKGLHLEPQATYNAGADSFQASYIPADPVVTVIFTPVSTGVRTGVVRLQHFY